MKAEAPREAAAGGRHRHPDARGGQQENVAGPVAGPKGDSTATAAGEAGLEDQNGIAHRGRRASQPPATTTKPPRGAASTGRGPGEGDGVDVAAAKASAMGELRFRMNPGLLFPCLCCSEGMRNR